MWGDSVIVVSSVLALISGLIHIYFFMLESILWGKPSTNKVFSVTAEEATAGRIWAFNQGYYNLFLAFGALAGGGSVILFGPSEVASTLLVYSCLCMMGAGVVLVISNRAAIKGAIIQSGPPFLAVLFWILSLERGPL